MMFFLGLITGTLVTLFLAPTLCCIRVHAAEPSRAPPHESGD